MRLNVNRLLHTPDASQEVRFEMDLSQLDFGGAMPITRPVTVEGRIRNQAGVLLCQLEMHTTLHCVCDRCMEEFDAPKSVSYSCVLAEEKQEEDSDEIILLEHDEVDLAELARDASILHLLHNANMIGRTILAAIIPIEKDNVARARLIAVVLPQSALLEPRHTLRWCWPARSPTGTPRSE